MFDVRVAVPAAMLLLALPAPVGADGGGTNDAAGRSNAPVWGASVRGLQIGIALGRSRYRLDDAAVAFDVLLRNVTDTPVKLVGYVLSPGTRFETRRGYSIQSAVLTSTGQHIPEPGLQKLEGPGFKPCTIATGQTIRVTKSESLRYFDLGGLVPGMLLVRAGITVREPEEEGGWHGTLTVEAPFEMTLDGIAWGKTVGAARAGILAGRMEYGKEGEFTIVVENLAERPIMIVGSNGWEVGARRRDGRASEKVYRLAGGVGLENPPRPIEPKRVALAHHTVPMPTLGEWSAGLDLRAGAVFWLSTRLPYRIGDRNTPEGVDLTAEAEVTMTNSPWAPLPAPRPMAASAEPWGDEVDGVQCRLVPHKATWRPSELPTLELQVRNRSSLDYSIVLAQQPYELSVDGCRYTWSAGRHFHYSSLQPSQETGGILVSLGREWRARLPTESPGRFELRNLSLAPGNRTVRFALNLRHGNPKGGTGARSSEMREIRIVSNPVTVEVLAE